MLRGRKQQGGGSRIVATVQLSITRIIMWGLEYVLKKIIIKTGSEIEIRIFILILAKKQKNLLWLIRSPEKCDRHIGMDMYLMNRFILGGGDGHS